MGNISSNRFEKASVNLKSGKKKTAPVSIPSQPQEPAVSQKIELITEPEKEMPVQKETKNTEKTKKVSPSKPKTDTSKYAHALALSAIKKERGMPKTVYFDADTVKILNELSEKTGAKTSPIVNLLIKIGYENFDI